MPSHQTRHDVVALLRHSCPCCCFGKITSQQSKTMFSSTKYSKRVTHILKDLTRTAVRSPPFSSPSLPFSCEPPVTTPFRESFSSFRILETEADFHERAGMSEQKQERVVRNRGSNRYCGMQKAGKPSRESSRRHPPLSPLHPLESITCGRACAGCAFRQEKFNLQPAA